MLHITDETGKILEEFDIAKTEDVRKLIEGGKLDEITPEEDDVFELEDLLKKVRLIYGFDSPVAHEVALKVDTLQKGRDLLEKRNYVRVTAEDLKIRYQRERGEWREASCKNISIGGIKILAPEQIPQGSSLLLEIDFPDGSPAMKTKGKVAWSSARTDGSGGGIQFISLGELHQRILERYIEKRLSMSELDEERKLFRVLVKEINVRYKIFGKQDWKAGVSAGLSEGGVHLLAPELLVQSDWVMMELEKEGSHFIIGGEVVWGKVLNDSGEALHFLRVPEEGREEIRRFVSASVKGA